VFGVVAENKLPAFVSTNFSWSWLIYRKIL